MTLLLVPSNSSPMRSSSSLSWNSLMQVLSLSLSEWMYLILLLLWHLLKPLHVYLLLSLLIPPLKLKQQCSNRRYQQSDSTAPPFTIIFYITNHSLLFPNCASSLRDEPFSMFLAAAATNWTTCLCCYQRRHRLNCCCCIVALWIAATSECRATYRIKRCHCSNEPIVVAQNNNNNITEILSMSDEPSQGQKDVGTVYGET